MAKCKPCMSHKIKSAIAGITQNPVTLQLLDKIPECKDADELQLCGVGVRSRSAYQQFVSGCMKSKDLKGFDPEAMKDCARQWREKKGESANA